MATLYIPVASPWGGELNLGPSVGLTAAILGILVAAAIIIRLTHVFVRGIVRALLNRENVEGTAHELTAAEIKKRQDTIETLVVNVVRFFVVVIAALMILETAFSLDIGPAIAGLGIIGIAVGLGTQSLVRDYLNGALVLIENQYSIGDVVQIAGVSGKVEDFTLRRTTLRDQDGAVHTVPNGLITVATNLTREWARVNEDVRVVYGTDIEKATAVVDRVGRELASEPDWGPRILEAPRVERVSHLGEYGVTLKVLGTVRASEQWAVSGELRRRILAAFAESGIEMPQPQRIVLAGPKSTRWQTPGEGGIGPRVERGEGKPAERRRRPAATAYEARTDGLVFRPPPKMPMKPLAGLGRAGSAVAISRSHRSSMSSMTFSLGKRSTAERPSLAARTNSMPADRTSARAGMPTVRSMSETDTPLLARFTTMARRSRISSSTATSRNWTAARMAGTSGVTGTMILSARSKMTWLSGP